MNVGTNPIGMIRSSGVLAVATRFQQLPNNTEDMPTTTGKSFIGIIPLLVTMVKVGVVFFVLLLSSATEYGIFYFFAIPRHQATEPLFFDYLQSIRQPPSLCNTTIEESATTCSRPTEHTVGSPWAVVDLFAKHTHWEHFSKDVIPPPLFRHRRLRESAPYYIEVALDLPESPLNIGIGMFSVQVELQSSNSTLVATSLRATRLPHETKWVSTARKFLLLIPLAIGAIHETRRVVVPSFRNFVESKDLPLEYVTVRLITSSNALGERDLLEVIGGEIRIGKEFNDFQNLLRDWFFTCYAVGVLLLMVGQVLLFFVMRYLLRLRRERRERRNAMTDDLSLDWNENEEFDGDASAEWESLNSNVPTDQTSHVVDDASTEQDANPPPDPSVDVAESTTLPLYDSDDSDSRARQEGCDQTEPLYLYLGHHKTRPSDVPVSRPPQNEVQDDGEDYDELTDTGPAGDRTGVEESTTMFPQLDDAAISQKNKRDVLESTAHDMSPSTLPTSSSQPATSPSKSSKSKTRSKGAA